MRGPLCSPRLVRFREVHLLRSQSLFAIYRSPGRCRVPAAHKLLINAFVAATAVASRQFGGDYKSMMIFLVLPCGRLVAVQAVHTLSRVHAHFVLVHDRVLGS